LFGNTVDGMRKKVANRAQTHMARKNNFFPMLSGGVSGFNSSKKKARVTIHERARGR